MGRVLDRTMEELREIEAVLEERAKRIEGLEQKLEELNDPASVRVPVAFEEKVNQLCSAIENDLDLPPIKYGLLCGRLINEVKEMIAASKGEGNE